MNSAAQILAELERQGLSEQLCEMARLYEVSPANLCAGGKVAEIAARHRFWRLAVVRLGSLNAVAQVFGVEHASVLCALRDDESERPLPLLSVLLASYESPGRSQAFKLRWRSSRTNQFGVTDRVAGSTTWFGTYALARAVYDACLAEVDAQTNFAAAAKVSR